MHCFKRFTCAYTLGMYHHYPHLTSEETEAIDYKEHVQNDPVSMRPTQGLSSDTQVSKDHSLNLPSTQ